MHLLVSTRWEFLISMPELLDVEEPPAGLQKKIRWLERVPAEQRLLTAVVIGQPKESKVKQKSVQEMRAMEKEKWQPEIRH